MKGLSMGLLVRIGQEIKVLMEKKVLFVKQGDGTMMPMEDYLKAKYPKDFKEES